jgi:hypothetical protein
MGSESRVKREIALPKLAHILQPATRYAGTRPVEPGEGDFRRSLPLSDFRLLDS